jgi:hypothetical protein
MATKKKIANAVAEDAQQFDMPQRVKDWIDRAGSIMSKQKSEIDDLKKENKELKSYRAWAEKRILQMDIADKEGY